MKTLVTGVNGLTGSHLARLLLAKGHKVRGTVRKNSSKALCEDLDVEYVTADFAEDKNFSEIMKGIDVVYHVAACFRDENNPKDYFWKVNVGGTKKLLEAAKAAGIKRFVHCSTVGVQGDIDHPPAKEEYRYAPGDYYQESKVDGELAALDFFKNKGLWGSVVRPAGIYGPGDNRFLKLFKFISNGKFKMLGDGKTLYHLTHVKDLAEGIYLAGQVDAAQNEIFTIGGDGFVTLDELVKKIANILGKPVSPIKIPVFPVWLAGLMCEIICKPLGISPPIFRRRVDFFTKSRAFDISKARRVLNYSPKISLDQGLKETAEWYKKQRLI